MKVMDATVTHLQWHLGFYRLRLPIVQMHNLTIAVGLVVCMSAGALTVVQETLPVEKMKTYRFFKTARKAGRKTKETINDLWN
jgi:hypothetical protein